MQQLNSHCKVIDQGTQTIFPALPFSSPSSFFEKMIPALPFIPAQQQTFFYAYWPSELDSPIISLQKPAESGQVCLYSLTVNDRVLHSLQVCRSSNRLHSYFTDLCPQTLYSVRTLLLSETTQTSFSLIDDLLKSCERCNGRISEQIYSDGVRLNLPWQGRFGKVEGPWTLSFLELHRWISGSLISHQFD